MLAALGKMTDANQKEMLAGEFLLIDEQVHGEIKLC